MTSLPADEAIATRRSVRAFLPAPVELAAPADFATFEGFA